MYDFSYVSALGTSLGIERAISIAPKPSVKCRDPDKEIEEAMKQKQ